MRSHWSNGKAVHTTHEEYRNFVLDVHNLNNWVGGSFTTNGLFSAYSTSGSVDYINGSVSYTKLTTFA